jgi:hypothetical protein
MAASGGLVVCEALCFVQNQFVKLARSDLLTTMIEFYTYEEVLIAKKLLFDFATSVNTPNCPAFVDRKGNNKVKACVDDILTVYALLDVYKTKLPLYVAANPLRIPGLGHSTPNDVLALGTLVNELREQVAALTLKLEAVLINGGGAGKPSSGGDGSSSGSQGSTSSSSAMSGSTSDSSTSLTDATSVGGTSAQSGGWAKKAASLATALAPFTNTVRRPTSKGKRPTSADVKTIARNLSCFCGRLTPDTTEAALKDYLAESGIHDAVCRKLVARNGLVFRTAAFQVSCSSEYYDLFYNEDSWPEGAELRDWYFRFRQNGAA